MASATAGLEAASESEDIRLRAGDLLSIAATFCGAALALIEEAAADEQVQPLFDSRCRGRGELQGARDKLLVYLRGGCLRCNGLSPFDKVA